MMEKLRKPEPMEELLILLIRETRGKRRRRETRFHCLSVEYPLGKRLRGLNICSWRKRNKVLKCRIMCLL